MKIGILTFYRTENFGANLQALSTYKYLEKNGFEPIMIHYMSHEMHASLEKSKNLRAQVSAHFNFVDKYLPSQTQLCFNVNLSENKTPFVIMIDERDCVIRNSGDALTALIHQVSSAICFPVTSIW